MDVRKREVGRMAPKGFLERFGPWALVTGASSGIGEEFAHRLAASGLNVVLAARRQSLLDSLGANLTKQYGVQTRTVMTDLSQIDAINQLAAAVSDLDIGLVISNAGTGQPARFLEEERADKLERFRLNSLSHLDMAYVFGQRLKRRERGGLIFGGAMGAVNGIPFLATDAGAKSFVQSLSESLHVEWKPYNISVMTLVIPPTQTAIIDKFGLDPASMPMKPMSTEQCVSEALRDFVRGRSVSLPGRANRIMSAIVPASVARKMMGVMIERTLLRQRKSG